MLRTLALIALAPALAFAKTSVVARDARAGDVEPAVGVTAEIVVGAAGTDLAMSKLRVILAEPGAATVRLVFTVSTESTDPRQAVLPLALPTGAQIVNAAVSIGDDARVLALTLEPDRARSEYQSLFRAGKDPLLVELVDPAKDLHAIGNDAIEQANEPLMNAFTPVPSASGSPGFVNYVVHAFPVVANSAARIELTIELPEDSTRLVIAHTQRIGTVNVESALDRSAIRTRHGVRAPIAMALPAPQKLPIGIATIAKRTHVDAAHSLFAGWAPRDVAPIVTLGVMHDQTYSSVGGREIRRTVKQHLPQLARCYTKVTEYRGGQEGTAVMHFFIATNGTIPSVTVDGEIDDERITSCLANEVRQWEFPGGDSGVLVNYPLHFQLAR